MPKQTELSDMQFSGKLFSIKSTEVDSFWDKVLPLLRPALKLQKGHDEHTLLAGIKDKSFQLWIITADNEISAAIITEIVVYPLRKGLRFFLAGGKKAKETKLAIEYIESWAKSIGCTHSEIIGRKGWARLLSFKLRACVMEKEYYGRRRQ